MSIILSLVRISQFPLRYLEYSLLDFIHREKNPKFREVSIAKLQEDFYDLLHPYDVDGDVILEVQFDDENKK